MNGKFNVDADKAIDRLGGEWGAQAIQDKKRIATLQVRVQQLQEENEGLKASLEEKEGSNGDKNNKR